MYYISTLVTSNYADMFNIQFIVIYRKHSKIFIKITTKVLTLAVFYVMFVIILQINRDKIKQKLSQKNIYQNHHSYCQE